MNLASIRVDYEVKQQALLNAIESAMEEAVNYEELLVEYGAEDVDPGELEWNAAKDQRQYDTLQSELWMVQKILDTIDETLDAGDDVKKAHRARKSVDTLITSIREIKVESEDVIAHEKQVVDGAEYALSLLEQLME